MRISPNDCAPRLSASGNVRCAQCGGRMISDLAFRARYCPIHGVLAARIVRHPLWEGEVVDVLCPSQTESSCYVVRFASGKRRTVWFSDLRVLEMHQTPWLRQGYR